MLIAMAVLPILRAIFLAASPSTSTHGDMRALARIGLGDGRAHAGAAAGDDRHGFLQAHALSYFNGTTP